jgi:hypothetical protein
VASGHPHTNDPRRASPASARTPSGRTLPATALGPVASSTSDATGAGRGRSMLAFRSVVSVLLRELGDFSLHPQGRPCGPAAPRPSPRHRPHRSVQPAPTPQPDRHVVLARPGATSGPHTAGPPGTTAVNEGQSSSQVSRPIQGTDAGRPGTRFSLARRKPGVQNPLTSTPNPRGSERRQGISWPSAPGAALSLATQSAMLGPASTPTAESRR